MSLKRILLGTGADIELYFHRVFELFVSSR